MSAAAATEKDPHLATLASMLKSLGQLRLTDNAWVDSEREAEESQVFKQGEGLRTIYYALVHAPLGAVPPVLSADTLSSDTRQFFKVLQSDGFFASPYAPIGSKDQYTEFAAFTIDFCDLVHRYWSGESGSTSRALLDAARHQATRAFDLLTAAEHFVADDNGVRWAGTTNHTRKGKAHIVQRFTDVYFTSVTVIALHRALNSTVLNMDQKTREYVQQLIQRAGKWIAGRDDRGVLTGDEAKNNRNILYSTWGLRAIAETYHLQTDDVRTRFKALITPYLSKLREEVESRGVTITQDYLPIYSAEFDTVLTSYEERSGWAGVVLTLLSFARLKDVHNFLEASDFDHLLSRVVNGLMALRNLQSDLWYREFYIVSIHSYAVEALLGLHAVGTAVGYSFDVTPSLLERTVLDTLADARFQKLLNEILFDHLQRLAVRRDQAARLNDTLSMASSTSNPPSEPRRPRAAAAIANPIRHRRSKK
jgi:hypothetical protein